MKHLVLLTIDCLRYDRCGFNGWFRDTTPFLDEIASESIVFDRAYAPGSHTLESFPGILAGQLSYNNAIEAQNDSTHSNRIQEADSTIADKLKDFGMETVGVLSNPSLSSHAGFDSGFREFQNLRLGTTSSNDNNNAGNSIVNFNLRNYSAKLQSYFKKAALSSGRNGLRYRLPFLAYRFAKLRDWPTIDGARVVSNLSDKIINISSDQQSVFAWGHLNDLHVPLHPAKASTASLFKGNSWTVFNSDYLRLTQQFSPDYNAAYEGVLRYVDGQIKLLVENLKESGMWENTILVVTADHGEALADRGNYGHPPHYLFNECLHVPLLIRTPNGIGTRVNSPFSLAWLHELIADILGISRFDLSAQSGRSSHIDNPGDSLVIADSLTANGYSVTFINEKEKYVRFSQDIASIFDQHYAKEWLRNLRQEIDWEWENGIGYDLTFDFREHNPSDPTTLRKPYKRMAVELENSIDPSTVYQEDLPSEVEDRLKEIGYID